MSENKAVQKLDALHKSVREFPGRTVVLSSETAAQLLDYIEGLENEQGSEIKAGDKVKTYFAAATVKGGIPEGSVGEVVSVRHQSMPYPYEVQFDAEMSAMYGFHELKKVQS